MSFIDVNDVTDTSEAVEAIAQRVDAAKKLLREATHLADKFDIPFDSHINDIIDVKNWEESAGWNDSGCEWQDSGCTLDW